ncbi:uncharacterized protein BJ171DRAFT_473869 [Polychytrium aggregatum]|uniref:uncharacterized protein n=1 Tax=Polychytrium aggregatum TaxID=110093 RepID=UPI0022FEC360|nr:uncharacterized protein BJ171DRAFT_473869 [Polychytrium aggregatum]KAI9205846.1 hypothetical protein BJ171DRAFT_473869 [Polychytrium aggregatum]
MSANPPPTSTPRRLNWDKKYELKRAARHCLKFCIDHRPLFLEPFDIFLSRLLDDFVTRSDSISAKMIQYFCDRAPNGTSWTVWVSTATRDKFRQAKAAVGQKLSHAEFVEILLAVSRPYVMEQMQLSSGPEAPPFSGATWIWTLPASSPSSLPAAWSADQQAFSSSTNSAPSYTQPQAGAPLSLGQQNLRSEFTLNPPSFSSHCTAADWHAAVTAQHPSLQPNPNDSGMSIPEYQQYAPEPQQPLTDDEPPPYGDQLPPYLEASGTESDADYRLSDKKTPLPSDVETDALGDDIWADLDMGGHSLDSKSSSPSRFGSQTAKPQPLKNRPSTTT